MSIILIALGGALGGVLRYLCMAGFSRWAGDSFPWGTLLVNGLGTFLLGSLMGAGVVPTDDPFAFSHYHAFFTVGLCGGFTTFSTFSLQTMSLLSAGKVSRACANILGSVALCLLCATSGYALMERLAA